MAQDARQAVRAAILTMARWILPARLRTARRRPLLAGLLAGMLGLLGAGSALAAAAGGAARRPATESRAREANAGARARPSAGAAAREAAFRGAAWEPNARAAAHPSAASPPHSVRVGPAPPLASAAAAGAMSASVRMHVTVVLRPRNPAALAAYARAVSTPGSAVYHAYLTPAQFAARFGAPPARVRAVERSLRAHGLAVGRPAADGLSLPVSATAGVLERAFAVSLRRVALRGGRRAVVASAAPALDAAISPYVQAVIGLSSLSAPRPLLARAAAASARRRPRAHLAVAGPSACPAAIGAAASQGAYTADQIARAYGFDQLYAAGGQGQGVTVALYELESYDPGDIRAYQACYGTSAAVTNVAVDGGAGSGPGSGEAALDLEQAIGLAPRASFLVYEGPNSGSDAPGSGPYDTLSAIVNQDRAQVVSISWGQCEQLQGTAVIAAEETLFEEAAAQGQSVVSATGDEGSEDCNQATPGVSDSELAVDDPGSQPFVTGVGGTSLSSLGPPPSETVWNQPGAASGPLSEQGGAGGGGISSAWAMPGYQTRAARALNVLNSHSSGSPCAARGGDCRQVPDVSADADPAQGYIFYWNGSGQVLGMPSGWQAVGGTSAAAPVWAALLADADSSPACLGSAIGFANPALYAAAGADYGAYFNDVLTGDNDFTGTHGGLYPAGPGYDMASGLGSPRAGPLADALCADALRIDNPGPQVSTLGQTVSLRIRVAARPGSGLRFYATQLPPGLSISSSTGLITGRPRRIGSWLSGVAALGQDLSLRAAFFAWRVAGPPTVSGVRLSGVGKRRPRLTFMVAAGRNSPALRAISVGVSGGLSFAAGRVTVTLPNGRRVPARTRVRGRRLEVALMIPAARIRVSIAYAALRSTPRLAADVRARRSPTITVAVLAIDTSGRGAAARARVRPLG